MSDDVQRYWMGGGAQIWVVEAADYDKLAAELDLCKRQRLEVATAYEKGAHITEAKLRIAHLESALTLLTNGMKYSTEVVRIAREALK